MIHNEHTHKQTHFFSFAKELLSGNLGMNLDEEIFRSWYLAELENSLYRNIKWMSCIV